MFCEGGLTKLLSAWRADEKKGGGVTRRAHSVERRSPCPFTTRAASVTSLAQPLDAKNGGCQEILDHLLQRVRRFAFLPELRVTDQAISEGRIELGRFCREP
ncbi:hypothetical protein MTO96_022163 [Rhipicephalus appendiculatus]